LLARERTRGVSAFYLEALFTVKLFVSPRSWSSRTDSYNLGNVFNSLQLSEPDCEEPGSDSVIE